MCWIEAERGDRRPAFHQNKDELIAAMNKELAKIPGVLWNFSQPIEDNMEEAVSGVKGELATKIYGDDLNLLEQKVERNRQSDERGERDCGLGRVSRDGALPNLNITVDRDAAARYQINVADVQDVCDPDGGGRQRADAGAAERGAVRPGDAVSAAVSRPAGCHREDSSAVARRRERVSLAQLCHIDVKDGASEIYREGNERYIAVKYGVRDRDLGGAVEEAMAKVNKEVQLPRGYHLKWEGEYESAQRARARLAKIVPITILLISMILYMMFRSFKWAALILVNVLVGTVGGFVALLITNTNFSVSSGVGMLALFGVSVQTGVIMLEYINQRRARGFPIEEAAIEGAVLRLRPIMMTMLVATLGLLPAALSHEIGSDSQRPFAIVIVGGLIAALGMSVFLLPTLYVWIAKEGDVLPEAEEEVG